MILQSVESEEITEEDLKAAAAFYDDICSGEYFKQNFVIEPNYEIEEEELKWLMVL